jgi:hypothetical protein
VTEIVITALCEENLVKEAETHRTVVFQVNFQSVYWGNLAAFNVSYLEFGFYEYVIIYCVNVGVHFFIFLGHRLLGLVRRQRMCLRESWPWYI